MPGQVFLKPFFTAGGTDYTPVLASIGLNIQRTEVDDSRLNDKFDQWLPGTYSGEMTLNFKAASGFSLLRTWMEWLAADNLKAFVFRPTTAVKSNANPELQGNIVISKSPPMGGDRGTLFGAGSITLKISGSVTWDDDGTDIVIGA